MTKVAASKEKVKKVKQFISFFASGDLCHLLKTFENYLDPNQDQQNVGPDQNPNCYML